MTFLALGIISCTSGSSENYQDTKMSLEEQERQNPTSCLSVDGTYRKNLIGEWVIEGEISNTATLATYKDVVLEINYYSKTKTHLGTEKEAIYEYFPAGQAKKFKIKSFGYKGASAIGLNIINASTAD